MLIHLFLFHFNLWNIGLKKEFSNNIIVGVMNFGQVKKIRFVIVKIFQLNSNQLSVILIRSSELASN